MAAAADSEEGAVFVVAVFDSEEGAGSDNPHDSLSARHNTSHPSPPQPIRTLTPADVIGQPDNSTPTGPGGYGRHG